MKMVLKKFQSASEDLIYIDGKGFCEEITRLPKEVIIEIKKFIKRNKLGVAAHSLSDKNPIYYCCPMCLKAHLINKNFKKDTREKIEKIFNCPLGHNGYYLDKSKVIKN